PVAQRRCHYSRDLKERVIHLCYTLGLTTTEIARILNMSLRVVQCVLKVYEEIGAVANNPKLYAKQGRARLLTNRNVEFLLALLEQHPDIYLDELAEELNEQHGVSVSLVTIQRMLKLLGITTKK
ncbi:Homeodomain-like protein, partial [Ramaria rubella]